MKRQDYINWDELFMGIARLASDRSKDPRSQHGACIVNSENKIVSIGFNGFPTGISDDEFPWDRELKDDYVIHAEINAILNATSELKGSKLYLYSSRGYYPCSGGCAQAIVQVGIKEVVLHHVANDDDDKDMYHGEATKRMFDAVGIKLRILEE